MKSVSIDYELPVKAEHLICMAFRKAQDKEVKGLCGEAMVALRIFLSQVQGNVVDMPQVESPQ